MSVMLKIILQIFILILFTSCEDTKPDVHFQNSHNWMMEVKSFHSKDIILFLKPKNLDREMYFSVSLHQCHESQVFSDKKTSNEEKNESIAFVLKQNKNQEISLLFYKESKNRGKEWNPFIEGNNAITGINNEPFGVKVKGIESFIVSGSGEGIILPTIGKPIPYDSEKGYQIILHMKPHNLYQSFLVGVIRFSFFNPGLDDPTFATLCKK